MEMILIELKMLLKRLESIANTAIQILLKSSFLAKTRVQAASDPKRKILYFAPIKNKSKNMAPKEGCTLDIAGTSIQIYDIDGVFVCSSLQWRKKWNIPFKLALGFWSLNFLKVAKN